MSNASADSYTLYKRYVEGAMIKSGEVFPPIEKVSQLQGSIPYSASSSIPRPGLHIGQRKLFLSELKFLTMLSERFGNEPFWCVYAGAGPGHHTYYLTTLFPRVRFILIDATEINMYVFSTGNESNGRPTSHRKKDMRDVAHMHVVGDPNSRHEKYSKYAGKIFKFERESEMVPALNKADSAIRIFILESYMTDSLAREFSALKGRTTFVSDIRTTVQPKGKPNDVDVLWN